MDNITYSQTSFREERRTEDICLISRLSRTSLPLSFLFNGGSQNGKYGLKSQGMGFPLTLDGGIEEKNEDGRGLGD